MRIDESAWPVVRLDYDGPVTAAEVTEFQEKVGKYLDQGEHFALVVVAPSTGRPEPGTAKAQLGWMRREYGRLRKHVAGMAHVATAADLASTAKRRSKLRALLPYPQGSFATVAEAMEWAENLLRDGH